MIDSHCHLDFSQFDSDRADVITQAKSIGVTGILIPGTQASRWQNQIHITSKLDDLYLALGLHPYFLDSATQQHLLELDLLLNEHKSKVVAVGEIGLDFMIETDEKRQQYFFESQLDLAVSHNLPVIIHHRRSHNQLIRTLKQKNVSRSGVIHAFSGSEQEANTYIEMGFCLGIGGTITYPRAQKTRQAISNLPLTSLLLETDAPDMPMAGRQGQRNSPEYLPQVLDALSSIRQESRSEIEQATDSNFNRVFLNGENTCNDDNGTCKRLG